MEVVFAHDGSGAEGRAPAGASARQRVPGQRACPNHPPPESRLTLVPFGHRITSVRQALTQRFRRARRAALARRYLHGQGVEIGALHLPLDLPDDAHVLYLDRMSTSRLREEYPELRELPIVDVGIVDDGERLDTVAPGSLDFIVANHVIEHCQDPIGTVGNWLARLRPGGVIYMAVPDRRRTFDKHRAPTTAEHLLRDHHEGPVGSRAAHYREWVDSDGSPESEEYARRLNDRGESIHFHVWTPDEFRRSFIGVCRSEGLGLELVALKGNLREFIAVARKRG